MTYGKHTTNQAGSLRKKILCKVKDKKAVKHIKRLDELEWEIYDKTGSLPVIYWEFEYKT